MQTILDLFIPCKESAKTCSQMSYIYFQSHSAVRLWTNIIPKGTMKTRFEPGLLTMPLRKNIKLHLMELNSFMRIYSFFIKVIVKGAQAWAFFARIFCTKQTIWVCDLGTEPKNPFFKSFDPWFRTFLVFWLILRVR